MSQDFFVHETAVLDPLLRIGRGTRIWHFCHVMSGAQIGENCVLGQNVFVASNVRLGNNVHVQNNVSIYDGLVIEDDVFCGPSMVFTNVTNPRSGFPRKDEYRETLVRRGATIGANATVLCGHTLGRHCFIAAGAVVTGDVPDFALVMGTPGRVRGWMSRYGERLSFDADSNARCPHTGDIYQRVDASTVKLLERAAPAAAWP